jgi:hypothetical protein
MKLLNTLFVVLVSIAVVVVAIGWLFALEKNGDSSMLAGDKNPTQVYVGDKALTMDLDDLKAEKAEREKPQYPSWTGEAIFGLIDGICGYDSMSDELKNGYALEKVLDDKRVKRISNYRFSIYKMHTSHEDGYTRIDVDYDIEHWRPKAFYLIFSGTRTWIVGKEDKAIMTMNHRVFSYAYVDPILVGELSHEHQLKRGRILSAIPQFDEISR